MTRAGSTGRMPKGKAASSLTPLGFFVFLFFSPKIMLKNAWRFCNSILLTLNAHLFMALSTSDILPKECAQYCLLHLEN